MGACSLFCKFSGKKTKEEIKKEFKAMSGAAAYRSGHEYSGDWNMMTGVKFPDKKFNSIADAREYIEDFAKKWDNALCVRCTDTDEKEEIWLMGGWAAS